MAYLRPGKRGRNVFKLVDGSFQETEPSDHTLIAHTYHGGHVHTVEGQEQADLVAAGYGAFISFDSILKYKFSSAVSSADPGPGKFTFDSSTPAATTEIEIDWLNSDNFNTQSYILSLDIGIGILKIIYNLTGIPEYCIFNVSYISSSSGYFHVVTASHVSGSAPANNENCVLVFTKP